MPPHLLALALALTALDSLNASGKMIGIISHVVSR